MKCEKYIISPIFTPVDHFFTHFSLSKIIGLYQLELTWRGDGHISLLKYLSNYLIGLHDKNVSETAAQARPAAQLKPIGL